MTTHILNLLTTTKITEEFKRFVAQRYCLVWSHPDGSITIAEGNSCGLRLGNEERIGFEVDGSIGGIPDLTIIRLDPQTKASGNVDVCRRQILDIFNSCNRTDEVPGNSIYRSVDKATTDVIEGA